MPQIRTIYFGSSAFGLPSLDWLWRNTELVAVITTPDKPVGRKQELVASPIKKWAVEHNIPLLQPDKLKTGGFKEQLTKMSPDVGFLASYGRILPQDIIDIPKKGIVNLHPSLLPKYRGATPIQSAILAGEEKTGVSLIVLDSELDHGPIIAQREIRIEASDTYESLQEKLSLVGSDLVGEFFLPYAKGEIQAVEQNHEEATLTKPLKKEDGLIDWTKPVEYIERMIRAYNPWPGTFTHLKDKKDVILKIIKALSDGGVTLAPGEGLNKRNLFFIGTGTFALQIMEVQMSGGKKVSATEFLRGFRGELKFE